MCGWWWGRRCGAPVGLQPGQVPHTFYGGTALADAELEAGFGSVPALVHQELQEVIQNPADGDVQALPVPGAQVNKAQLGEGQAAEVFRADLVCVGVEATVVQIAGQGVGVGVADADRSQRALLGEADATFTDQVCFDGGDAGVGSGHALGHRFAFAWCSLLVITILPHARISVYS